MQTVLYSNRSRLLTYCISALLLAHGLNLFGQAKENSVLSTGQWYKIAVEESGIYRIDKDLIDNLGISAQDAAQLKVYGNRGGMLPQLVSAPRIDDLQQLAVLRSGLDDGSFDNRDYILFYAEGPSIIEYDPGSGRFSSSKNIYDNKNHYFLGFHTGAEVKLESRESLDNGDAILETFNDYVRLEEDRVNLLGKFRPPGSGKRWFGDEFSAVRQRFYNIQFPNIVRGTDVEFTMEFAGRSGQTTTVTASVEGNVTTGQIGRVTLGDVESSYARIITVRETYPAVDDIQEIQISYPAVGGPSTEGWIDYIEMQAERELRVVNQPLFFRNTASTGVISSTYRIDDISPDHVIWDITDPLKPVTQEYALIGGSAEFTAPSEGILREFVAFRPGSGIKQPEYVGRVNNQNLHSLSRADLVIVYPDAFEDAAMRLAQHRADHNGYAVAALSVNEIMNEFAGGSMDATGIRDFARMLKERDPDFRYLLLLGDGTYDYRHINKDLEDDNFVPVYETFESMNPIRSFPSDDYFSLLNPNEGDNLLGAIDIAVGRLTVGSENEAIAVVEKIIHYDVSPTTLGDWRQRVVFVADDEDNNLHLNQAEDISAEVEDRSESFNLNRIYLDAFTQESTPGGPRYPDANAAINNSIFQGVLAINYLGHGGPQGWAQERILRSDDIQSWTNFDRLPLFITATCSFTGYDEPGYVSAGEQVLLNAGGGAVALLTTVRPVYASSNKRLTESVFDFLLEKDSNGEPYAVGDIMRLAKNSNAQDTIDINARKFAIIGDPSMVLAYPRNQIVLTELNGEPVGSVPDTAGALDQVSLKGQILDPGGAKLGSFNGKATVTLYDKPVKIRTLANDPKSFEREFENFSRVIFKGTATVVNGEFAISFVIPKDIDFNNGLGKISMYATDEVSSDAAGSSFDLVIGGSSINGIADDTGPVIDVFLNSEAFQSGDVVGPNSTLLVKLFDESGINVTGNSIGHDLVASLDGEGLTFKLNEFYEAAENDFTRGEVRFPLANIPPGRHTITVVAWDAANNFSEATIDFVVESNPENVVREIISYPNPGRVSEGGTTFRIQHDLQVSAVDVTIEVFDIQGRLVSTVEVENAPSNNGLIDGIEWSAETASPLPSGSGIYFYRALLGVNSGANGQQIYESDFNKLVLFN